MSTVEIYLGYSFDNPELLNQALTHPSFSAEQKSESPDNQRLEFLGDAVIEPVSYTHLTLPTIYSV